MKYQEQALSQIIPIVESLRAKAMENDKNIEYIIGIDLGHGETSAALCPTEWDKPIEQLTPAKDLDMGGNKKVFPSAITILENGDAYIGDRAFRSDILKQASVNVCFKQAPKDINGEKEKLMMRFMKEVYRTIIENNSATLHDGNHKVYIATPSGWDSQTQHLYEQMAEKAGLPIAGVTKESRAAFVRAQADVTSGLGRNISKGAIVFDMGSSTLDFTYLNQSQGSELIDNGYNCGASAIEKLILHNLEETSDVVRAFEKKYPKLKDRLLFEARTVKEQAYFDPTAKVKRFVNFEELIDEDEDFEDERFKLAFAPGELNKILDDVGYIKEIEDAMADFKNNHINGAPIYGVFLTGGASRMDFIKPLIAKIWEIPEENIYRDQDPSLTISEGVAEVARIDLRTEGMDIGLADEIDNIVKQNRVCEVFTEKYGDALKEDVIGSVNFSLDWFIGNINYENYEEEDFSLEDLKGFIKEFVEEGVDNMKKESSECFKVSFEIATENVRNKIDTIVANYTNKGTNVTLPTINFQNIDINDINLDEVINEISKTIDVSTTNWLQYGLAGAGLIFGLIGASVGFALGKWLGGDKRSDEEKQTAAMKKALSREERVKVYDSILEKGDEITQAINNAVDRSLRDKKLEEKIQSLTFEVLEEYKKSLKDARILID